MFDSQAVTDGQVGAVRTFRGALLGQKGFSGRAERWRATVPARFKVAIILSRLSEDLRVQGLDQSLDLNCMDAKTPPPRTKTGSQVQAEWKKTWKPKRRRLGPDSRTITFDRRFPDSRTLNWAP